MSNSYRFAIIRNIPIECSSASLLQSGNINCYQESLYSFPYKYNTFWREITRSPIPVCEDTLLLFVTNLAQQDLSNATIQVYLSAVQYRRARRKLFITGQAIQHYSIKYVGGR